MRGKSTFLSLAVVVALAIMLCPGMAFADLQATTIDDGQSEESDMPLSAQGSDIASATAISLNKQTSGTLTSKNSEEWYRIDVASDGKFELVFDGDYKSAGSWNVELYAADNQSIFKDRYKASNTVSHTVSTTGLAKGRYYIRIKNYSTSNSVYGLTYRITPKFTASSTWETELNDLIVTADPISLGKTTNGNLQSNGGYNSEGTYFSCDHDWYRVVLKKKGSFGVLFKGEYRETGNYQIDIYNEANERLSLDTVKAGNTKATVVGTANLEAGVYYVHVRDHSSGGIHLANTSYSITPYFVETQSMYRLYNPNSGEHFYTASTKERDGLKKAGWKYEGVGWTAPTSSKVPVYRLYSGTDHHYTTSAKEKDNLVKAGWKYEGIGWYSDDLERMPLYRQYNPNVNPWASHNNSGSHNYTTSKKENDKLVKLGWKDEGVGWYGVA